MKATSQIMGYFTLASLSFSGIPTPSGTIYRRSGYTGSWIQTSGLPMEARISQPSFLEWIKDLSGCYLPPNQIVMVASHILSKGGGALTGGLSVASQK